MSYNDPISLTISGSAVSLPRVSSGVNSGAFSAPDGTNVVRIAHAYGKRTRRTVRLENSKIATDPLTAANAKYSMTAYLVVDVPPVGYSVAEAQAVVTALNSWLTTANVAKLLGGEN